MKPTVERDARRALQRAIRDGQVYLRRTGTDSRSQVSIVVTRDEWENLKSWAQR